MRDTVLVVGGLVALPLFVWAFAVQRRYRRLADPFSPPADLEAGRVLGRRFVLILGSAAAVSVATMLAVAWIEAS
jgi:hypothetical protein